MIDTANIVAIDIHTHASIYQIVPHRNGFYFITPEELVGKGIAGYVAAQVGAAVAAGAEGWSVWNPAGRYDVTMAGMRLAARRRAIGYIYDKQLVHALFDKASERYGDRNGGYTRILKLGTRHGDNAEITLVAVIHQSRHIRAAADHVLVKGVLQGPNRAAHVGCCLGVVEQVAHNDL